MRARKRCHCTAPLNQEGVCIFKCPPSFKHRVDNRTSRPRTLQSRKGAR